MIIDEILDATEQQKFLNIDYIKKQAELFELDSITKAINKQNVNELKTALKNYIIQNEYNKELLKDIDSLKIDFDEPSKAEQIKDILQYLATHNKNYTNKQYYYILELKELLEV